MKTVLKSSLASGLFPTLPQLPDSGVPPFTLQTMRECMTTSLPLLFTGNSRLACFQISDSIIIHLPFSLSLSVSLFQSLSLSVCLPLYLLKIGVAVVVHYIGYSMVFSGISGLFDVCVCPFSVCAFVYHLAKRSCPSVYHKHGFFSWAF